MRARRSHLSKTGAVFLLIAVLLIAHLAEAQTPTPLLPGETPEASRPYATYWLSFVVLAGIAGLILALGFAYWKLSSRFYGREEPPPPRQRPRFAGMSAAQPVAAAPQGAASAQPGAVAAARADRPAGAPAPAPATVSAPAAAGPGAEASAPAAAAKTPAPPEEKPPEEKPPEEKPAEEKPPEEKPPEEKPPAEPAAEKAAAPAPATPAAGGQAEPDQETFDRVLQEQLDKGVDRRVAEGRARAAGIKAAREKAGAG